MPAVSISPQPKLQFFDSAGSPLAGGKLYTYAAGTTTPLASYTDSTGNVANANPVVLDARGEASVWLAGAQYKLALYTAANVLVWTVDGVGGLDQITLAALAASGGSSLVGFLQAGTGAVARTAQDKMRDEFSVKDFGGSLSVAVSAIGSTKKTLVINDAVTVSANLTIPANVTLRFESTGLITINSGARLFINGPVQADRLQQIFSCSLFTNNITASINGNALVITAVSSNTVAAGQIVSGSGLRTGLQIFQAFGTGTGTYTLNGYNGIVASQAMTLTSSSVIFGTGTVEEVYPAWFGAVKDGVTDCTTAIALSVYSHTWGGTVRFPAGGYVMTGSVVLHPGIIIEGDGANNDYSGSPPPTQVSFMSTIFVGANNIAAFVISERCNQVNIQKLVFSTANPPYLSGGDYAPFGTNRKAIVYEGHAPQGVWGGVIESCHFFGFTQAILVNDSWAGTGDGVGPAGTYWNGTASVTYYDWGVNPVQVRNCQFFGNSYGIQFVTNNADDWRILDCVFILSAANCVGVQLNRCGFLKLDSCFAAGSGALGTEFVNLVGVGAEALDSVTLDNCQAESCAHFVNFVAGSTNTTPPAINVHNSIHQMSADVYLGSPCEYNSQNNQIMSYIYVQSTGVRINSINDHYQWLNFSSGATWGISIVSGDANTIYTYLLGRKPSSLVTGPIISGAPYYTQSAAGSPVGVVTPARIGQVYLNTSTNVFFMSTGLAAANWVAIN